MTTRAPSGLLTLEDQRLRVSFDDQRGALVEMIHASTGWTMHRRPELGRSFRLLVPLPDRRNHVIDGDTLSIADAALSTDQTRLTLRWDHMRSGLVDDLDISLKVEYTLAHGVLGVSGSIMNRSPYRVDVASVPVIGDLYSGGRVLQRLGLGYAGGEAAGVWPRFANQAGYWGTPWPIQFASVPESPFMLLQTEDEGLYLGCQEDEVERTVQFVLELRPGASDSEGLGTEHLGLAHPAVPDVESIAGEAVRIEASIAQFVFAGPGASVALTPMTIVPYSGPWQRGADICRTQREPRTRANWPAWVGDIHAWQQIQLTSHQDELRYDYADLIEIGRECAANGIAALQITGWTLFGQDGRLPSHDIDPRLGTLAGLKDAIAAIQSLGVRVILYVKFTFADISTERYRTELHRWTSIDEYGNPHVFAGYGYETLTQLAGINTRRLAVMCLESEGWLQVCEQEFTKLMALGADGILSDENQHHAQTRYCFSRDHGHAAPAHHFAGDHRLGERLRALAPDEEAFLLAGEACYDAEFQDYSLAYFRTVPNLPGIARYVAPFQPLMVGVPGLDDRNLVNTCLLRRYIISYEPRHFRGRLSDAPATVAYGRMVDSLRRRNRQLLWDGAYRDEEGATVEAIDQPTGVVHSVFSAQDADALVIVNTTALPLDVRYQFDVVHRRLERISPEAPDKRAALAVERVEPRSAIVIVGHW